MTELQLLEEQLPKLSKKSKIKIVHGVLIITIIIIIIKKTIEPNKNIYIFAWV